MIIYYKSNFCIDCHKKIDKRSTRCKSCATKGCLNYNFGRRGRESTGYKENGTSHQIINCPACGKKLKSYRSNRCSSCAAKERTKISEKNPNYKNGVSLKIHNCIYCGNIISYPTWQFGSKRCIVCFSKTNTGKNNPMFGKRVKNAKWSYYNNIWMRSSWEVAYAKWLDKQNIKWQYESKTFDLGHTSYTPDFYLPETNEYIEIKGWWRTEAKKRFELFKQIYSEINITVLEKKELMLRGIKLRGAII